MAITADFTGTPRVGEEDLSVVFTDTSVGTPITWRWDLGDDTIVSGSSTFTHVYTTPGIYTVSLDVSDASLDTSSITKTSFIVVEAPVYVPDFIIAKSNKSDGKYWELYVTESGYIVFETADITYRSKDKIVDINKWSFVHLDFIKSEIPAALRLFFGDVNRTYKEIEMIATYTISPESPASNRLYAALNSSFKLDELKIWGRIVDDKSYFKSLYRQASLLS
jgi:hypothetical protein